MNHPTNPFEDNPNFRLIRAMNQWRRQAQRLLHDDTRYPEGWSLSAVDATKVLAAFPCLFLEPGWTWVTFQYMSSGNGNSITYAVPEEHMDQAGQWLAQIRKSDISPFACQYNELLVPVAMPHLMNSVIGDGSPESFAQASLLIREIGAIGACWHGAGWSMCDIFQSQWIEPEDSDWELSEGCRLPADSTPLVFIEENVAHCRFYVKTDMGGRCISIYEDIYFGSSLRPETVRRLIASSKRGGWMP